MKTRYLWAQNRIAEQNICRIKNTSFQRKMISYQSNVIDDILDEQSRNKKNRIMKKLVVPSSEDMYLKTKEGPSFDEDQAKSGGSHFSLQEERRIQETSPVKKSQPVGGSYNNYSSGPSRTAPRFLSSRTEDIKSIYCYGCGTSGVIKSKCPTCTRTKETETAVNCMTLFKLNSNSDPSSLIVLRIFGEKIAVRADTDASHIIAGENLVKFLQVHDITFAGKIMSFMMADGIRQTITMLSTVVNLYIPICIFVGKVIPTEFLVLPEAKGNKTLLGWDFLNAAGNVLHALS
ncbi:uncharacterized protein NPIL_172481 [Nephila pilipes]|uniref:Uncharacterized protein n=1 Tax=Nephila pilipes TaxID=299642 RepID=A0A8X6MWV6_NEPPI|nr:uncharacterized protein NPIL_172481 [Nephila pilipes]